MKKYIVTTLAIAALCMGANAQIGGGLLNKAKAKATKAVDNATTPSSGGNTNTKPASTGNNTTTTPASSGSGSKPASGNSGSTSTEETPKGTDWETPTKDLKKYIGETDLYYSAILAQGFDSKVIVPKIVKTSDYMAERVILNAVNFNQENNGIYYCYFGISEFYAQAGTTSKIDKYSAESSIYQEWSWRRSDDYTVDGDMMYNRWGSGTHSKGFIGIIKQADGSIITFIVPQKKASATKEFDDYVTYIELEYNPIAATYDLDNMEVEILTKTEAAAKTADLNAAKALVLPKVKKILESYDAKEKLDAEKKIATRTRSKRGMVNATFEKKMLDYLQANFKKDFRKPEYWENATLGNLIIGSTDWSIVKNEYGLILSRYIWCEVVIKNKGKCFVKSYQFAQEYSGGGNYSSNLYYNGFSGDLNQIKCDKAN